MSNRQNFEDNLSEYDEEDFFCEDSDSSICSEDEEILGHIDQVREKEQREKEQREKDKEQIRNFPVDILKYNWTPPTESSVNFENVLLEEQSRQENKSMKVKGSRGAGFKKTMPNIVYGPTDIVVKPVLCIYFLRGNCTRSKCTFYHPVDEKCKFDTKCTNPKCVFVHTNGKTRNVQLTPEHQNKTEKLQTSEKCKHRICLNTLQIVDNNVVPTLKTCKHGNNCNFAHSIKEIVDAIKANPEKFKCSFGQKCRHVCFETLKSVINKKQTTVYTYKNNTEFCNCPRVHHKESVINFIVRVHTARRPPKNNA